MTIRDREIGPFVIVADDGFVLPFAGYVGRVGPAPYGTRYGKPRRQPKLPRKLKKALTRYRVDLVPGWNSEHLNGMGQA